MHDPTKDTTAFYNRFAKPYLKEFEKAAPAERSEFLGLLKRNSLILDAGCAGGRDSKFFMNNGHRVIGVDVSKQFIRYAKKDVPQARFFQMDIRKTNFPAKHFDGIWAQAVLLHLERKGVRNVLENFYRILRPNGLLNIQVKHGKGSKFLEGKKYPGEKRYFTYFTKSELVALVQQVGFQILHSEVISDSRSRPIKWVNLLGKK